MNYQYVMCSNYFGSQAVARESGGVYEMFTHNRKDWYESETAIMAFMNIEDHIWEPIDETQAMLFTDKIIEQQVVA